MKQIPVRDIEVGNYVMIDGQSKYFEEVIEVHHHKSCVVIFTSYENYEESPTGTVVIRG